MCFHRLEDFAAWIEILSVDTHSTPTPCQSCLPSFPHKSLIEDKIQCLFINIYQKGRDAFARSEHDRARWIFTALIHEMDPYPPLYDAQKKKTLLALALTLEPLGLRSLYEQVLSRLTTIEDQSSQSPEQNPCQLLADSLPKSSQTSQKLLGEEWHNRMGDTEAMPPNLGIFPLQRAALIRNPKVLAAILAHSNSQYLKDVAENTLSTHDVQKFTSLVAPKTLDDINRLREMVDIRDFRKRTPLFSAAGDGCNSCVFTLLVAEADPDTRDSDNHTILEVASRGGHYRIVEQLIKAGCAVNPQLIHCASTPLQAAVESKLRNHDVIRLLLQYGANVNDRRPCDDKNAIDIARAKGDEELLRIFSIHDDFPVPRSYG